MGINVCGECAKVIAESCNSVITIPTGLDPNTFCCISLEIITPWDTHLIYLNATNGPSGIEIDMSNFFNDSSAYNPYNGSFIFTNFTNYEGNGEPLLIQGKSCVELVFENKQYV